MANVVLEFRRGGYKNPGVEENRESAKGTFANEQEKEEEEEKKEEEESELGKTRRRRVRRPKKKGKKRRRRSKVGWVKERKESA